MGRHRRHRARDRTCEMKACENDAVRSLPIKKIERYLSTGVKTGVTRRVHICKVHYKEYKKASKEDRKNERLGRFEGGLDPQ